MVERQHDADAPAHRIAHDVDPAEPEMVDEVGGVPGQRRQVVRAGIGELGAGAMAAHVHGDGAVAGLGERVDPAGRAPVDRVVGGEAVDEEDRIALPVSIA